jgi:hypothetical protein
MATNPSLVEYGIHNEASDIRIHVCPLAGMLYVFPTECGRTAAAGCEKKLAYQPGVNYPTAEGYIVPLEKIRHCVGLRSHPSVWAKLEFKADDPPSIKGDKAVVLVVQMIKDGLVPFPFPPNGAGLTHSWLPSNLQLKGEDIFVSLPEQKIHIQVKCDFRGGIGAGCTGNLFLQTHELNPLSLT